MAGKQSFQFQQQFQLLVTSSEFFCSTWIQKIVGLSGMIIFWFPMKQQVCDYFLNGNITTVFFSTLLSISTFTGDTILKSFKNFFPATIHACHFLNWFGLLESHEMNFFQSKVQGYDGLNIKRNNIQFCFGVTCMLSKDLVLYLPQ